MDKIICEAGSKELLQNAINEYYNSASCVITDDNKVFNTKSHKMINIEVYKKNGMWRAKKMDDVKNGSTTRKALKLLADIEKRSGCRIVSHTIKNGVCYYQLKGNSEVLSIAL